jgi:hypothetical protein
LRRNGNRRASDSDGGKSVNANIDGRNTDKCTRSNRWGYGVNTNVRNRRYDPDASGDNIWGKRGGADVCNWSRNRCTNRDSRRKAPDSDIYGRDIQNYRQRPVIRERRRS